MWNLFGRRAGELEDEADDHEDDDDLVDGAALRIIARWVAERDGMPHAGTIVDRAFVVSSLRY